MRDTLRTPDPNTCALTEWPWSVGQQWLVYDTAQVAHALLPDSYKYSVRTGKAWPGETTRHLADGTVEREVDDRERVKHVVITAGPLDEDGTCTDFKGVVADLTAVFTPGKLLPQVRSPRLDADLGEYICKLHNDELARKQAAKAE